MKRKKQGIVQQVKYAIAIFLLLALFVLIGLGVRIFSGYTQDQLYGEAVNQLTEITGQLFERLSMQLTTQWGYLEKLETVFYKEESMSDEELAQFLTKWEDELSPVGTTMQLLVIDNQGFYYNDQGMQGVWPSLDAIIGVEQKSFLISDWATNENQMAFAKDVQDSELHINGRHVSFLVLLRRMEDMSPFFRSSVFHNRNITYVVDENGTKMFEDTTEIDLGFVGRNLYYSMQELTYPHVGSFDACIEEAKRESLFCTDVIIDQENYYLCIKTIDGYDWSIWTFVPVNEVASSTRTMINSLVQVFMLILLILILVSIFVFLFVMKFRKNQELLLVKTQSEERLAKANEQLEEANRKLEIAQNTAVDALETAKAASKAKSEFLANMSHDIRTPMNAIIGITALIDHDADSPQKIHEYTEKINRSSQHLLGLINEVLDMSKIESGKLIMNVAEFNLRELIDQVEMSFRPQMNAKEQHFEITTDQIMHEWLMGDNVRIMQILNNLLSNALKYTPAGGTIELSVKEMAHSSQNYAKFCFTVKDNGIGMSKEYLGKIFESFSREQRTTVNAIQGTGLGMAIVKNLVDFMGGSIAVNSVQGKGSCFEVILDFKISEKQPEKEKKETESAEEIKLEGMRFLCAEDNEINAEILADLLDIEGAFCEICENGQALVERFEQSAPGEFDMILMDIQMPIMDGYEATKKIRMSSHPLAKRIPIIAMTANAFSEDIQESLNAGMNAHVSKPVDIKVLAKTAHSVLSGGPLWNKA